MTAAFVFIQLVGDSIDVRNIHNSLHAISGVKTVHLLSGPTDMIVYLEIPDQKALMDAILKMHGIKGVGHTDTRIVFPI